MAKDNIITDEYVAEMLMKDAKDFSLKYSTMGLDTSRSANKLKPNTRFLRHIIKETKSHNEALLAKEAAESQARLDQLAAVEESKRRKEEGERRKQRPDPRDVRRRQLGDITAILSGRKRKYDENEDKEDLDKSKRRKPTQDHSTRNPEAGGALKRSSRSRNDTRSSLTRRSSQDSLREERYNASARPRQAQSRDDRKRRNNSRSDDETRPRQERKQRDRSRSPRETERRHRDRSRSPGARERRHRVQDQSSEERERERSHRRRLRMTEDGSTLEPRSRKVDSRKPARRPRSEEADLSWSTARQDETDGDDTDPLEDIIGPRPPTRAPLRARGRGALKGPSDMDVRFSDGYNPSTDVEPDKAEENWEEALEAFRDRQKWKQQGAGRLREAGFSEEQVKKLERGGEKDIGDVRWTKQGEKREWDRGKLVGADGAVTGRPDWSS